MIPVATLGRARRVAGLAILLLASACAPRLEPAGPSVGPARMADGALVMPDGATLPLRRWLPPRTPRAVVLALHGFNDHANAFAGPGAYWAAEKGIATYAYDQRGFGAAPNRGLWAGHDTLAADAAEAARLLRAAHPDTPLFVAGESMGGAVAMIAAANGDLRADGLVLLAPALRGRAYLGAVPRAGLWLMARLMPWFPVTGQGLKIQASDNIEMLRALGRDPLYIRETRMDALHGLVDAMDAAGAASPRLRLPALILYGTRDEIVPPRPILDMIGRLPADPAHRTAFYRTGWHLLLRDLEARIVMDDIAAWIADRAAPLPSGGDRVAPLALTEAVE